MNLIANSRKKKLWNKPSRISTELFSIQIDSNRYIIYAPLRKSAFITNSIVVNLLTDIKNGERVKLPISKRNYSFMEFLRQIGILDDSPEKVPITEYKGDPCPTAVTLFLTTACNLRCVYCYASSGDTPAKFMEMDVAKRAIDFVSSNAVKKGLPLFEVAFHGGGEPSVNWQTLTRATSYARLKASQLGIQHRVTCATNGFLTDSQIDWIIGNLHGVSLSFDGLPAVHDKLRPTVLGLGSSGRVLNTIRKFDNAKYKYGIRVTVPSEQIPLLPSSIEYICRNANPQRIQVEPSYQMGRWQNSPSAETEEFIEAYREAYMRAKSLGGNLFFSAARVGHLTNHFCSLSQDAFAISPEGNVSSCFEVFSEENILSKDFFYGKPTNRDAGYIFDLKVLSNLRSQSVQNKLYCKGCFAKWHCAGDCHYKALLLNGNKEFKGTDRCHITRELTKDQILERIANSGGIFWHDKN